MCEVFELCVRCEVCVRCVHCPHGQGFFSGGGEVCVCACECACECACRINSMRCGSDLT